MSPVRAGPVIIIFFTTVAFARPVFAANPRAEAAARDALSKAEGDFLGMNYASGAARLDKALRACAPANCPPEIQASLLRDIGTMEFRAGDKGFATKAFTEALKLQPNIDLNPSYDSPDLRAAWAEVKGAGGGAPPAGAGAPPGAAAPAQSALPQPTGDFVHIAPGEGAIDTPLPIYVEGGPAGVAHVIVRYKNSEASEEAEWNHMDLSRIANGWGGVIPCNAVVGGTMLYFIQGYNKDMDPIANNGDAKKPYQVPIHDEFSGQPPHLPNRPAPKACHAKAKEAPAPPKGEEPETAAADCPPGMPGCGKAEKPEEEEEGKGEEEETETEGKKKKKSREPPRWWVGVAVNLDFIQLPSGNDLCRLVPLPAPGMMAHGTPGTPANDKHIYCTDATGADFPLRSDMGKQNNQLSQGTAGTSAGGVVPGDLRLMLSLDYAASSNIMVGARAGYVLLGYPGKAAISDGNAWGQKFYFEARITGVLGKDPLRKMGAAPMLFVGAGVSPFDGHTSGTAALTPPMGGTPQPVPVDFWMTNGPGFVDFGGGVRYATSPRVGLIGALRVNVSFGNNGLLPTAGPEVGLQYAF